MSQATTLTLNPDISGTTQRTLLNTALDAFNTLQSGTSRPTTAEEGTMWLDTSGGSTAYLLKVYNGSSDVTLGTLNMSTASFVAAGQLATFANATINKTGTASVGNTEYGKLITLDATSASFAINISAVSGLVAGWYAIFKKTDSSTNTITLTPNGSDTIDGGSTYILSRKGEGAILINKGSGGFISIGFADDNLLKQSSSDTTAGYLADKLTVDNGFAITTVNPGADEQMKISFNFDTNPGLELNTNKVRVKVDGTTITRGASGIAVNAGTGANQIVQLNASSKLPAVDGSQLTNLSAIKSINVVVFTSSGTYTPSAGIIGAEVRLLGGGGGGGGSNSTSSPCGGGGAGGFTHAYITAATLGASQSVTIGGGGAGGTSSPNSNAGAAGGTSTFGSLMTAYGGGGGAASVTGGGAGGSVGGNLLTAAGNYGFNGNGTQGGNGGGSQFGGGGRGSPGIDASPTGAGSNAAGGGGAGTTSSNSSHVAGGAGGGGFCHIIEFIG